MEADRPIGNVCGALYTEELRVPSMSEYGWVHQAMKQTYRWLIPSLRNHVLVPDAGGGSPCGGGSLW